MTRVLVITTGGTPQLVTETVFALLRPTNGAQSWRPERIILATTAHGCRQYWHDTPALCGPQGQLARMYAELGELPVEPEVAVAELAGQPIADIRSREEVSAFGECLLGLVEGITSDNSSQLHLSIAGGRKTMGGVALQVMSILGRPQDMMSHCLIEPASLEGPGSGFWWPEAGHPEFAQARVDLHPLPFIRLRAQIDPEKIFGSGTLSYEAAVDRANTLLAADNLLVDLPAGFIEIGSHRIPIKEKRDLAALSMVAYAAAKGALIGHTVIPYETVEWGPKGAQVTKVIREKWFTWDGDIEVPRLIYALFDRLMNLERIYEGFPEQVTVNANRLVEAAINKGYSTDFSGINQDFSGGRSVIRKFNANLSERAFPKGRQGTPPQCAMEPDKIQFLLPHGLNLEELVDAMLELHRGRAILRTSA